MTRGELALVTNAEWVTKDTPFLIVVGDITYNTILERSWIHKMDAVPLTLQQVIKFPFKWGL